MQKAVDSVKKKEDRPKKEFEGKKTFDKKRDNKKSFKKVEKEEKKEVKEEKKEVKEEVKEVKAVTDLSSKTVSELRELAKEKEDRNVRIR